MKGGQAVCFIGGVGSGKSEALNVADFKAGWSTFSLGDIARNEYESHVPQDTEMGDVSVDGERPSLSKWAGERKKGDPAWAVRKLLNEYVNNDNDDFVAIDGVRSIDEVSMLQTHFREVQVVWVWAPFYTRLERTVDRGRDDASTPDEFFERDLREWNWGLDQLTQPAMYDVWVPNTGTLGGFKEEIRQILAGDTRRHAAPWHDLLLTKY